MNICGPLSKNNQEKFDIDIVLKGSIVNENWKTHDNRKTSGRMDQDNN